MNRLSQQQFDRYYNQTNPHEPEALRQIHAIRRALADNKGIGERSVGTIKDKMNDFMRRNQISSIRYAQT